MEDTSKDTKNIFVEVENSLDIVISPVIKNVLLINGYNSPLVLANICEQDVLDMENFMRETAPLIIDEREYQSYYGLFHQKKGSFKFVPGQKKVILLMAEFFKSKYCQKNNELTSSYNGTSSDQSLSNKEAISLQRKPEDCEGMRSSYVM